MLKLLVENLSPEDTPFLTTHFSKRLVSYGQVEDGVTLYFADGTVAQADVVVGADGIGSATRRKMYTDLAERVHASDPKREEELMKFIPPSWTGTYAYRALLEREKVVESSPNNWILRGGRAVSARHEP